MNSPDKMRGKAQLVVLVVVAVVLAAGLFGLDRYTDGQRDMLTVETRGLQMISALGHYKQATGRYPETLDKLVPKHARAVSRCPDGQAMGYQSTGAEYSLSCPKVVFEYQPYFYDSRTKTWGS